MRKNNKILITGTPGWLGNRLTETLCKNRYEVRCLVLEGLDASNLKKFGAEVCYGNILKPETVLKATKGIDIVVHGCGLIHPTLFGIKDLYAINRDGTKNMIEASVANNVKRFIYISSNSAQGVNKKRKILLKESDKPKPYTPYGFSKFEAEKIVHRFQETCKIQTVILRPCWFYGPGQPARQTSLMKMIKSGKPVIFGNGENLRSMTYIDNLIRGIMLAMEKKVANGKTYWIADKRPYSSNEIYFTIAKCFGVKIKPRRIPAIVSYVLEIIDILLSKLGIYIIQVHVGGEMVRDIACSIEKAKKELGYKPRYSLEEGMKISIDWAKEEGLI